MLTVNKVDVQHETHRRAEAIRAILTPEDLGRLFWLSGSTCAGKTTVSSEAAERLGWNVYHCDDPKRYDPKKFMAALADTRTRPGVLGTFSFMSSKDNGMYFQYPVLVKHIRASLGTPLN